MNKIMITVVKCTFFSEASQREVCSENTQREKLYWRVESFFLRLLVPGNNQSFILTASHKKAYHA